MSGLNFNPQNTTSIPPVKIYTFLELEQKSKFFKGFKLRTTQRGLSLTIYLNNVKLYKTLYTKILVDGISMFNLILRCYFQRDIMLFKQTISFAEYQCM